MMIHSLLLVLSLLGLLNNGACQIIQSGQCDLDSEIQEKFNIAEFEGTWYEIEAYPKKQQQGECVSHEYTTGTENTLNFKSSQVYGQTLGVTRGSLRFTSNDNSAEMLMQITENGKQIEFPFWIVSTDYDDYALAYSCVNVDAHNRRVFSWKLSRTRSLSAYANAAINNAISKVDILRQEYYKNVDQSDEACFYYPVPNDEPVIFRGQCDENISVVSNFNPSRYAGVWYDIESYPVTFQDGACPTAEYTLNENGEVDVLNTQVFKKQLGTIHGKAVVASNDGTAKFEVTFPVAGTPLSVTTPYWVLDTDYDNYALVYSCSNIDAESRRVSSWKLSRTKSLSQQSSSAIANAISKVQVLRQDYYKVRGHDDDSCFFYPDKNGGRVILDGQCEPASQISPVTNFNRSRYAGIWHQHARYQSEIQLGECTSNIYTPTQNGFHLAHMTIYNDRLKTAIGIVNQVTDGIGVFELNRENFKEHLYILDTDYDEFALLYVCRNINNNQKQIYSWQYSRTQGHLSAAAEARINAVISAKENLFQGYYVTTAHDDKACFYNPASKDPLLEKEDVQVVRRDGKNGDPIILDGQCEPASQISPVTNFNRSRYAGIWHQHARYQSELQLGECTSNIYTPTQKGFHLAHMTIYNERLETAIGIVNQVNDGVGVFELNRDNFKEHLYILDTDYDEFALLYVCRNINNNQKQIYSWQYSRTQGHLSAAAEARINAVISAKENLFQGYYVTTAHDDKACFYNPATEDPQSEKEDVQVVRRDGNNVGPVILDGQCEPASQISPVTNFNRSRYAGIWHQHARYQSELQLGECTSNIYTPTQNGFHLAHMTIYNDRLETAIGIVNQVTDGIGIFELNRENFKEHLYILDTDYDEFALLYVCRNINNNQKQIYSWQYSRTQGHLSAAAKARINAVISAKENLFQGYYVTTAHDDKACFYNPASKDPLLEKEDVQVVRRDGKNGDPIILDGQCEPASQISPVTNFNRSRYAGIWHQHARYQSELQLGECTSNIYTPTQKGFHLAHMTIYNERLETAIGIVNQVNDGIGVFELNRDNFKEHLYILDTDYDEFALLYVCRNINNNQKQIYSWQYSRTQGHLSAAAEARINAVISAKENLFQGYYVTTAHDDKACFYNPATEVPQSEKEDVQVVRRDGKNGGPVILDGQCEPASQISPVTNFNRTRYAGIWHQHARYQSELQLGECTSNIYTPTQNGFHLAHMTIYNDRLETAIGIVNQVTDGIGIFELNRENFKEHLYILDTDYDEFALLYVCRNINNNQKQIYSWQYSRTQGHLSAAAEARINAVISAKENLFQGYYVTTAHDDKACFYNPASKDPQLEKEDVQVVRRDGKNGDPIILDGQCEPASQISPVTNFNRSRYAGIWHQHARYQSELQLGECTSNIYTPTQKGFHLAHMTIYNERLETAIGIVNQVTDGIGVFELNRENFKEHLYILDTDYDEFALLYVCRNINNNQKQIYSWQYSRTQGHLSAAAEARINGVISAKENLFQGYYVTTAHDNKACFYNPATENPQSEKEDVQVVWRDGNNGGPVILNGQCEPASQISPVTNFNRSRYAGIWHQHARYQSELQLGECTSNIYTPTQNGFHLAHMTIYNDRLETAIGIVNQVTDGIGVFELNRENFKEHLYILDTDYDEFALLYVCRNINNNQKQIYSWQYSRTQGHLSAAAEARINAVISAKENLFQGYYVTTAHDDKACFYNPASNDPQSEKEEVQVVRRDGKNGDPVILDGQCEPANQISPVTNFNRSRYSGIWHQHARYQSELQLGECTSNIYTPTQKGFHLAHMTIYSERLETAIGIVNQVTDGIGVFELNRENFKEHLYILDTDYDEFALLYVCRNINNNQKQIYSWQYSRTQGHLSAAAEARINAVISAKENLFQGYYVTTAHDDKACFYNPATEDPQSD